MTDDERRQLAILAIGRILRIASRPFQEGDLEEYDRCRGIVLDASEHVQAPYTPNYARDRNKGAQGD
jgi:hypothetical protein